MMLWSRRRFTTFLAQSPLLAQDAGAAIAEPKQALNVMDFEPAARKALSPAHFAYLATGVDDEATLRANREGFQRIQLRPRRLVDVRRVDTRTDLFGSVWETPIMIAPTGSQKAFHPDGEVATSRAAGARGALQILSTVTTSPVEQVIEAAGRPVWFQLYATSRWEATEMLVQKAERAGCPVLVLTVDLPAGRNTETLDRARLRDAKTCAACHTPASWFRRKPMFDGVDMSGVTLNHPGMTWEFVRRLKGITGMKLVIKGIETREDAMLCCEHGADGILVSNHGGRAEESNRGAIDCLPEVVAAVGGRVPVMVDGGVRRGTDVFKALALGARAVGIGRPYLWGLSAFGQAGVDRVLEILRAELELVMKQCGARTVGEINGSFVTMR